MCCDVIRSVPQSMCSTLRPVLAGKLFYVRLLDGKKIADLGLLVKLTAPLNRNEAKFAWSRLPRKPTKEEKMKHLMTFSFFCYSLHMSLTAGWIKCHYT